MTEDQPVTQNDLVNQSNPSPGEAQAIPAAPPADAQTQILQAKLQELRKVIASGGGWFYWIAGLSIINTIITVAGGNLHFVVGLGVTQVVDAIIREAGGGLMYILLPVSLFSAGFYIALGYFSCHRMRWAFITGIVLYGLDALLLLAVADWLSVGFHVFALFFIIKGLKADSEARKIEAQLPMAG